MRESEAEQGAEPPLGRVASMPAQFHVFDGLREGVQVIDRAWRYVYVNPAAAVHGRVEATDLLGRRMMDVYPGIDSTPMFAVLRTCMETAQPQELENEFAYPDGSTGWFTLRVGPTEGGIVILSIDITTRKRLELEVVKQREELSAVLSCMGEAVITADTEGRVTSMNPAAERLTGLRADHSLGEPMQELVHFLNQRTLEPITHPLDRLLGDGVALGMSNHTVLVDSKGHHVPIASSGSPLKDATGAVRGAVVVVRDMTEEYKLSEMFQSSQRLEAVARLAGGVAHDFNNLLTVMLGYGELLLGTIPPDSGTHDHVAQLCGAAKRAADLTQQLLTFSRREVQHPIVLDLNDAVSQLVPMLQRVIREDIHLGVELDRSIRAVHMDPSKVDQILMNLVVNARDAMPDGGRLVVATRRARGDEVRDLPRDGHYAHAGFVVLTVGDTGMGMDEETQARLFEPFYTTKTESNGTGLGLSTVYGIVEQAGGRIVVESTPGVGTEFRVYLPARRDEPDESEAARPAAGPRRAEGRVLLVEDDDLVRTLVHRVLKAGGFTVVPTADAREALALIERKPDTFDVLLTDVVLPSMSGPQLAAQVREKLPAMKVAFMSGHGPDILGVGGDLGDNAMFVDKPVAPATLLRRLREFVERE